MHFLCYGTLWGQIRIGDVLPWSLKAELCVLNVQVSAVDEGHLYSSFQRNFLRLRYFSADGVYRVEDTQRPYPFVEIFVFDRDVEVYTLDFINRFTISSFMYLSVKQNKKATSVQASGLEETFIATTL